MPLNLSADWMIGVGPQSIRIDILDVAESSPRITGSIRLPACNLMVTPLAISPSSVRDHQTITAIAKQLGFGCRSMGRIAFALGGCDFADAHHRSNFLTRRDVVPGRKDRDAFKEQRLKGLHPRVGMETARDGIAMEQVVQGEETHALVMRHVGL